MPLVEIEQHILQQRIEIVKIQFKNEPEYHRKIIMTGDSHLEASLIFFLKWSWSGCIGEWIALSNHEL